ncbi:hypothetical protein Vadar_012623 [Vaccinium darrowii]|uniref:Uncharacterized protein n=1 Tax=Vaccinium darrowii TaxID=229202 RepID=A0ACB7YDS9_9ERIC|nr:hypothetical protein Vadar_012623 [Vaccinium darrowii]
MKSHEAKHEPGLSELGSSPFLNSFSASVSPQGGLGCEAGEEQRAIEEGLMRGSESEGFHGAIVRLPALLYLNLFNK